jgi:large subunit ribosomal protein L20
VIDRKVLSDLAITDPGGFAALVGKARGALPAELRAA